MPKYMIERTIDGAADLSAHDLRSLAQQSCRVLDQLGTQIQWVQSSVAGNTLLYLLCPGLIYWWDKKAEVLISPSIA